MAAVLQNVKLTDFGVSARKRNSFSVTKTYREEYVVTFDQSEDAPTLPEIENAAGLPIVNQTIYQPTSDTYIPFCMCTGKDVRRHENKHTAKVSVEYTLEGDDSEPQSTGTDPTSLAPKIIPYVGSADCIASTDWDDIVIVTPVGEMWDQPVVLPIALPSIKLIRYVPAYDEDVLAYWKYTTNDATWRGKAEDEWWIADVEGAEVKVGSYTIGQLTFDIQSNPLEYAGEKVGWKEGRMLIGTRYRETSDPGSRIIVAQDDEKIILNSVLLNPDGTKKTGVTPDWVFYRKFRQVDFGDLLT